MKTDWLIIDGYSLMHRDPSLSTLLHGRFSLARERLVQKLERNPALDAVRTTVVFDGQSGGTAMDYTSPAVEVVFSPADLTADGQIERWVQEYGSRMEILVVTSDRMERDTVAAAGAQCMSCAQFLDLFRDRSRDVRRSLMRARPVPFRLGDRFPETSP